MGKTTKIQVTLDQVHYDRVVEVAEREGKKLAAVVREAIIRYCVDPEDRRRKLDAIRELEALEVPVGDYADWKREYAGKKRGKRTAAISTESDDEPGSP
jgi:predicted DNA-binding protein